MASSTSIPWQCWEAPGFKQCHTKQWEHVRALCEQAGPLLQQVYGGDMNRCINEGTVIRALEQCGTLCPQAAPLPEGQTHLPQDPTAIQVPQRLELPDYVKIMGAATVAGIVVWLVMRRKK